MTFTEIFEQPGLYVSDGFVKGVCMEVDKDGFLYLITYKDEGQINPTKENALVFKGLVHKDFRKVFTRQSLFQ